jgi:hypothetical protein
MAPRRAPNRGILVHRLLWSMSMGRPVKVLAAGSSSRVVRVVRVWTDPRRAPTSAAPNSSSVVVVFDGGDELAVNSIERVLLPLGESGAAFGTE